MGSQSCALGYFVVFVGEELFELVFLFSFPPYVEAGRAFGTVFLFLGLVPLCVSSPPPQLLSPHYPFVALGLRSNPWLHFLFHYFFLYFSFL